MPVIANDDITKDEAASLLKSWPRAMQELLLCGIPSLMLVASYGGFYKDVPIIDGIVKPSNPFGTLRFLDFPTPPRTLHLVLKLYLTAEVRGMLSYRFRRWMDELYRSQPVEVYFPDPGGDREFDYVYDVPDVIFPREGYYMFDVLLDGAVLHTAPLSAVQIKQPTET